MEYFLKVDTLRATFFAIKGGVILVMWLRYLFSERGAKRCNGLYFLIDECDTVRLRALLRGSQDLWSLGLALVLWPDNFCGIHP